jgi:hypothetical protein
MADKYPFSHWDHANEYVPVDRYDRAIEALKALVEHSQKVRDFYVEDYDSPEFLAVVATGVAILAEARVRNGN